MAQIATGDADEALDIVQDAMLTLVKHYRRREAAEWGPLFHRILQNRIRDWYRRQKVRNKVFAWFGLSDDDNEGLDHFVDENADNPVQQASYQSMSVVLEQALRALPLRQQQTFLLRVWEGMDVAETAEAMGISTGSVKTHFSRAVHTLREKLEDYRYE